MTVDGSRVKITRVESARGYNMAAHIYDCFSAAVTDVAIFPGLQNYKQAIRKPDASKWAEPFELELQQTGGSDGL